MIQSFTLPVDGGSYSYPNSNVVLQTIEGVGPAEPKVGHHQHTAASGGITFSQYYASRHLILGGVVFGPDLASYAVARRSLERAFTFNNTEKLFQFVTDDGIALQSNVMVYAKFDLKFVSPVYASWQTELLAADPILYSQSSYSIQGGVTTVTGGVIIPVVIPVTLTATLTGALSVTNNGNIRVFPDSVTINGPGTNFILTNQTTGASFLYNDTLLATDSVVFDFKRRLATKDGVLNVYGLTGGTWWDLGVGTSTITLTVGSGNTSNTKLNIFWHDGYAGL